MRIPASREEITQDHTPTAGDTAPGPGRTRDMRWLWAIGVWTVLAAVTTLVGVLLVDGLRDRMVAVSGGPGPRAVASRDATDEVVRDGAQLLETPGGTVLAACAGPQLTVRFWKPRAGYRTDAVTMDLIDRVEIRFVGDGTTRAAPILVRVTCRDGRARAELG